MREGLVTEVSERMTKIGNLLGLQGKFFEDFGFQQVEEKVQAMVANNAWLHMERDGLLRDSYDD